MYLSVLYLWREYDKELDFEHSKNSISKWQGGKKVTISYPLGTLLLLRQIILIVLFVMSVLFSTFYWAMI